MPYALWPALQKWLTPRPTRAGRLQRARRRLILEILEARELLAARLFQSGNVFVPVVDLDTVTSTINANRSLIISDLNVTLDIDHTWDSDLEVALISPNGTRVLLFSGVGDDGDNFRNTTLDDEATTAVTSGTAPFTGTFRPTESLAAFDGENARGTWTLEITDTAGGDDGILNSWSLRVEPLADDFGDTFATAQAISLSDQGTATQAGVIGEQGDQDLFRFEAIHTGFMTVRQAAAAGSNLDSFLFAYDDSGTLLASNDDFGSGVDSQVHFPVVQGQTYFLQADAFSTGVGGYVLSLTPDDHGDTTDEATEITLTPGVTSVSAELEVGNDRDVFGFVAPVNGKLRINLDAHDAGALDTYLEFYDSNGDRIAEDDDGGPDRNSELTGQRVRAGETYYVLARAFGSTGTGAYTLTFEVSPDDHGDTFDDATDIVVGADGSGNFAGVLEAVADYDVFRFTALASGRIGVNLDRVDGTLDPYLEAFDATQTRIALSDDIAGSANRNSRFSIPVTAGQTYYIQVSDARDEDSGSYSLIFTPDDHADTRNDATDVSLGADGSGTASGTVSIAHDQDVLRIVAPRTGMLTIRQEAVPGSTLDSHLYVLNASGDQVADNDNSVPSPGSTIHIPVTAGEVYFIKATGSGSSVGAYTVTFRTRVDDVGDDFATAQDVTLDHPGTGTFVSAIEELGDADVFRFIAPATGLTTLTMNRSVSSQLNTFLQVFDSNQRLVTFNDDGASSASSLVRFPVTAGETYLVRASAFGDASFDESVGEYVLRFFTVVGTPAGDDADNTFDNAVPLPFDDAGVGHAIEQIQQTAGIDVYSFTAMASGPVVVRLERFDCDLGVVPFLYVFDANRQEIVADYTANLLNDPAASVVQFEAVAGANYYVWAGSFRSNQGVYELTVRLDDAGTSAQSAHALPVEANNSAVAVGEVQVGGDSDFFSFTARVSGPVDIRLQAAAGSTLDTTLTVGDSPDDLGAGGTPLGSSDDSSGLNSFVQIAVTAGQTYYLRAAGFGVSTGRYRLSIDPTADDFANTRPLAGNLVVAADGSAMQAGQLEFVGDQDLFRYVATASTTLSVALNAGAGSSLDTFLYVLDEQGTELLRDDDAGPGTNSLLQLMVTAGQTYFFRAGAYQDRSAGPYELSIRPEAAPPAVDDFGNDFNTAQVITLDATGRGTQTGFIHISGDQDLFQFVAPVTGQLAIDLRATGSGSLDSFLRLFANATAQLASDDDSGPGLDSRIVYDVVANQTYFVRVSGFGSTSGPYELSFTTFVDDCPNTNDAAMSFVLQPDGSGTKDGVIESAEDRDAFRFVAPLSGTLTIRQQARNDSGLDSFLYVYDHNGTLLTSNDDTVGRDSLVQLSVIQGETYFVHASAYGTSTGAYSVIFSVAPPAAEDTGGNSVGTATPIVLSPENTTRVGGSIEATGDVDVYSFVARSSGTHIIRQNATDDSSLDSIVRVLDGTGTQLGRDDDSGPGLNSELRLNVTAGQTYFIEASAYGSTAGDYELVIEETGLPPGDVSNTIAGAPTVTLDKAGYGQACGAIELAGDADVFRVLASRTGVLVIDAVANPFDSVNTFVFVFDTNRDLIASSSRDGPASQLRIPVVTGQELFVKVSGFGSDTGSYRVQFSPRADDFTNDFEAAAFRRLDASNAETLTGTIDAPHDADLIQFTAGADGGVVVVPALGPDFVQTELFIYDESHEEIARNDARIGGPVEFPARAGNIYYLRVQGYGLDEGNYRITFQSANQLADDLPNTTDTARALLLGPGTTLQAGSIDYAGDVDVLSFTAGQTGVITVRLDASAGSLLNASLRALTADGTTLTQVASTDQAPGEAGGSQELRFAAIAGQTCYVRVAGRDGSEGGYQLSIKTSASDGDLAKLLDQQVFDNLVRHLTETFTRLIARFGTSPEALDQARIAIGESLVTEFVQSLGDRAATDFLLCWFDPVDYVVTSPGGQQAGQTAEQGQINEVPGAFLSRNGVLDLLVVPNAVFGQYRLNLIGVGAERVLAGATLITRSGVPLTPRVSGGVQSLDGLPVVQPTASGLALVLDFARPDNGPGGDTPGSPGGPGGSNGPLGNTPGSSPDSSAANALRLLTSLGITQPTTAESLAAAAPLLLNLTFGTTGIGTTGQAGAQSGGGDGDVSSTTAVIDRLIGQLVMLLTNNPEQAVRVVAAVQALRSAGSLPSELFAALGLPGSPTAPPSVAELAGALLHGLLTSGDGVAQAIVNILIKLKTAQQTDMSQAPAANPARLSQGPDADWTDRLIWLLAASAVWLPAYRVSRPAAGPVRARKPRRAGRPPVC